MSHPRPQSEPDDRVIVDHVLQGHTEAFAVLVERHQRMLHSVCHRIVRQPDLADEATQASFVQAFTRLAQFEGESFKAWLHAIAVNECRQMLRARKSRPNVPIDDVPEGALPTVAPATNDRAELERLVDQLPPRQRSVLSLRVFSDLTFRDIARAEGISENAAKVNFHHAISRLRGWLRGTS